MVQKGRLLFGVFALIACVGLLLGSLTGCVPPEPTPEPQTEAVEPEAAEEPAAPAEEPAAPAEEPAAPAEEPAAPAEEPAAPAEEPAAPAEEPAAPAEEPAAPAEEPAAPAEEPAAPAEEPAAPAEEPAAPAGMAAGEELPVDAPVSAYAPAEVLVGQVGEYMTRMEEAVATPDEYKDGATRIARDSNTMIVIALALGLHDQDSKLKAHAPAILKAAQAVAATEEYEAAKEAVAKLKAAVADGGEGPELKWEKVASLKELMEQVPLIHGSIRRRVSRRFERNLDGIAGDAATVAAIAQGTIPNADETVEPTKADEWTKYSIQMRNAAAQVLAAAQAKDEAAANAAFEKLDASCHACHKVFDPEQEL